MHYNLYYAHLPRMLIHIKDSRYIELLVERIDNGMVLIQSAPLIVINACVVSYMQRADINTVESKKHKDNSNHLGL